MTHAERRAYYSWFSNIKSRRFNRYLACINTKFGSGESEVVFEPLGSRTVYDIGTDYFLSPTILSPFLETGSLSGLPLLPYHRTRVTANEWERYLTSCLPRKGRNTMAVTISISRSFAVCLILCGNNIKDGGDNDYLISRHTPRPDFETQLFILCITCMSIIPMVDN